ncbi:hypothetical protein LJC57_06715 [Parabacteroides sp. OttesenSCG-928-G07]|nr:hypothetical protein [Parabacteroides sp. OttesenSCG-928-G21]MDL2278269.1 hypothetical protein [Parabacteroides sp. OttesenSCG-928-G07]
MAGFKLFCKCKSDDRLNRISFLSIEKEEVKSNVSQKKNPKASKLPWDLCLFKDSD